MATTTGETLPDDTTPAVTQEPHTDSGTVKRAKRVRGAIKIVLVAIMALGVGLFLGAGIVQSNSAASDSADSAPQRQYLSDTMYWGNPTAAEVDVVWVTSDVTTGEYRVAGDGDGSTIFDFMASGAPPRYSETLTFARVDITNRRAAGTITVNRIILELKDEYGVLLHSIEKTERVRIKAGEHGTIDLQDWVPTGLLRDVVSLRGRLGYSTD